MSETPKTQEACEAAGGTWDAEKGVCTLPSMDSKHTPQTDADLIRSQMQEIEMLKAKLRVREDQIQTAIKIANKANDQQAARDGAEREDLINRIVADSNYKWTRDELKDKTKSELVLLNTHLSKGLDQTFASVAAYQAEQDKKARPLLTAGAWDSQNKKWIGGL